MREPVPIFVNLPDPPIAPLRAREVPPALKMLVVLALRVMGPRTTLAPDQLLTVVVTPSPLSVITLFNWLVRLNNCRVAPARTVKLLEGLPSEVVADSTESVPCWMSTSPRAGSMVAPTRASVFGPDL